MAAVEFYEYFCKCGQYLFRNCDIIDNTLSQHVNYIFVDSKDVTVRIIYNNAVKCKNCFTSLGGFCHLINENRDSIRFCRHKLIRKEKRIYVHRVVDEDDKIILGSYECFLL